MTSQPRTTNPSADTPDADDHTSAPAVSGIEAAKRAARRDVRATVDAPVIGRRFRRPLTDAELDRIDGALRNGGPGAHGPAMALVELWDIILGEAEGCTLAEAEARDAGLRPNDYAIPATQRDLILERWRGTRSPRVRTAIRLSWHNRGPASYAD